VKWKIEDDMKAGRQEKRTYPQQGAIKARCAERHNSVLWLWNISQEPVGRGGVGNKKRGPISHAVENFASLLCGL
jgi:hypothetical protein